MKVLIIHIVGGFALFAAGYFTASDDGGEEGEVRRVEKVVERKVTNSSRPAKSISYVQETRRIEKEAKPLLEGWRQKMRAEDVVLKELVFEEVRTALTATDQVTLCAALWFVSREGMQGLDVSSFRSLVEGLLDHKEPNIRRIAFQTLPQAGIEEGDLERVYTLKDDPFFVPHMTWLLRSYGVSDFSGRAGEVLNELILQSLDPREKGQLIKPLHFTAKKMSPELQDTLLDLVTDPDSDSGYYRVFAFNAVKGHAWNSPERVRRLMPMASSPNRALFSNTLSLFSGGTPDGMEAEVAEMGLKYIARRKHEDRDNAMRLVRYCSVEHLALLEAALKNPTLTEKEKNTLSEKIADLTQ